MVLGVMRGRVRGCQKQGVVGGCVRGLESGFVGSRRGEWSFWVDVSCGERGVKDRGGGLGAWPMGGATRGVEGKVFLEWLVWEGCCDAEKHL